MSVIAAVLIVFATIVAMEGVAWASHKYVMHGFAWAWHRDHHEPHGNVLEKNDLFALVGAGMSIAMFALGSPWIMGEGPGRPRPGSGWAFSLTARSTRWCTTGWFTSAISAGSAQRLCPAAGAGAQAAPRDGGEGRRGQLRLRLRARPGPLESGTEGPARGGDRRRARQRRRLIARAEGRTGMLRMARVSKA